MALESGVTLPGCKHTANTATGIRDVTGIPRDEVYVNMHSRLASGSADIDANVVAVRRERELNVALSLRQQLQYGDLLIPGHVEEASNVAFRYDKDVTTT